MNTLFEISKRGLRAAERGLAVTSNNIVNANTPGYTRQRVELSPDGMQKTHFHAGLGVNITSVNRLRNEMNDVLINEKRQDLSFMEEKARVFEQLQAVMATDSGMDLDFRISRLFDAFSSLSTDPQDVSLRNNLISEATQLTAKMGDLSNSIERTSDLIMNSAVNTVNSINSLLEEINHLNKSIKLAQAQGKEDHAALDKRVQKLEQLSGFTDYDKRITSTGAVEISIGGIKILDENKASSLKTDINTVDNIIYIRMPNSKIVEPRGGRLGAEIEMFQTSIPDLKKSLDGIAEALVNGFNELHSQGYGLDDDISRNFFDPDYTSAAEIRVNSSILSNHNHIAASTQAGEAGNGDMAAIIANLRDEPLVNGRRFVDSAINLITRPGAELSNLRSQIDAREAEVNMLTIQQEREAGVSIDEELSQMIKFQNAYQGAARVMSAAQQMYDTLINLAR